MKKLFYLIFLLVTLAACQKPKSTAFDKAFVHSVYIWLENPDNQQDRMAFEESLNKFLSDTKYAKTKYVGTPPPATRDIVDDSFTYNLVVTFSSDEDQAAYQDEPAHKLFIKESSHLWKKVLVYDSKEIR